MTYFIFILAAMSFMIGLGFIYAWRRWPSADTDKPSEYLRRGDRNCMIGTVAVFWLTSAGLILIKQLVIT